MTSQDSLIANLNGCDGKTSNKLDGKIVKTLSIAIKSLWSRHLIINLSSKKMKKLRISFWLSLTPPEGDELNFPI